MLQKQALEQRQRQKQRQMRHGNMALIQANDLRVTHHQPGKHAYDGPMQFMMSPHNPDQVIPLQTNRISTFDGTLLLHYSLLTTHYSPPVSFIDYIYRVFEKNNT